MKFLSTLALFFLLTVRLPAAGESELAPGLGYLRVETMEKATPELVTALAANRALVLDLRYPTPGTADPAALTAALASRPGAASVFILVSPATPAALAEALTVLPRGIVTLGVAGSVPAPGVEVAQAADIDRRAYEAHAGGMALADLISGKIEKERFDEASLVKEFRNGNPAAAPPPEPDPSATPKEDKVPVLVDRVLQRAVHLHRALTVLKSRTA